jgi:hypothetical protein
VRCRSTKSSRPLQGTGRPKSGLCLIEAGCRNQAWPEVNSVRSSISSSLAVGHQKGFREGDGRRTVVCSSQCPASHAHIKPCFESGSERILFPVTVKIALHTAGKIGGSAGSPSPVGGLFVLKKCTWISGGASVSRTGE